MRLLWLPEVLRNAGLVCHEYPDWRTRGVDTFGPVRGIVCHGTGSSSWTTSDAGELRVLAITGSNSAPAVPISQLYLSRSGEWWVIASGTATGVRTGTGGPLEGYGDDSVLQIEAQHASDEPWSDRQYWSYVKGVRALQAVKVSGYDVPLAHVIGHGEHQPGQKFDPWFDMNKFRQDVADGGEGDMALSDEHLTIPREVIFNGDVLPPDGSETEEVDAATAVAFGLRHAYVGRVAAEAGLEMLETVLQAAKALTAKVDALAAKVDALSNPGSGETGTATITGGQIQFGPVE